MTNEPLDAHARCDMFCMPGVAELQPSGDVAELSAHLHRLVGEPGLLESMRSASRAIIARHAIDATLDTFERLYAGVAPQRSAAPIRVPVLRSA